MSTTADFKFTKIQFIIGNIRSLMKVPNARIHPTLDSIVIYLSAGSSKDARLYLDTDESYHLQSFVKGRRLEVQFSLFF